MAVSAHDVARVLRERLPGLGTKKLHKLLYLSQGHHYATFAEPLFRERVSAWDMGPVVGQLWHDEKEHTPAPSVRELDEAGLNTVFYTVSRYAALTGRDLEVLTHGQTPWQQADVNRPQGTSAPIDPQVMRDWFANEPADDDEIVLDASTVHSWLEGAEAGRARPAVPDDVEALRAQLNRG